MLLETLSTMTSDTAEIKRKEYEHMAEAKRRDYDLEMMKLQQHMKLEERKTAIQEIQIELETMKLAMRRERSSLSGQSFHSGSKTTGQSSHSGSKTTGQSSRSSVRSFERSPLDVSTLSPE